MSADNCVGLKKETGKRAVQKESPQAQYQQVSGVNAVNTDYATVKL